MFRRSFLALSAATLLAAPAFAGEATLDYKPGLVKEQLAAGKTVFVDYAADWCSTCKRQERIINALRAANPAYGKNLVFVRVDWDEYKTHDIRLRHDIPRRSTLIVLKGDSEIGRLVAATSESEIKGLLDKAVAAGA